MRTKQSEITPPLVPAIKWGNGGGASGGITDAGSNDWTMVRNALGLYTVTFIKPFSNVPVVVVTPHYGGAPGVYVDVQARSATNFVAAVFAQAGTSIDANIMFAAFGLVK